MHKKLYIGDLSQTTGVRYEFEKLVETFNVAWFSYNMREIISSTSKDTILNIQWH